ncbi:MAG: DUF2065 domain-containing protein [Candidatus Accumulibacter sp.]|jgi:uncharacterized protein YjeT (DUF2065 family)|nr:DUF2065 domain-containing protein [Accumulibacter sp.]
MSDTLSAAFALMLIFEGVLPLIAPAAWREVFCRLIRFTDGQIRFVGLVSMASGVIFLMILR